MERLQRADIDILAARIALAEHRLQRAAGEIPVGEREQIHRARTAHCIARTGIASGANGEAVPRRVQRHRLTEEIDPLQRVDIDIADVPIALAERAFQPAAGKTRIGKGEQTDSTGIGRRIGRTGIAHGADSEAITGAVQGH